MRAPPEGKVRRFGPKVVGIGGSAGGVEALLELLGVLPPTTGFAFVAVLHRSGESESLLRELLAGRTELKVADAEDGLALEANCLYLAPPDTRLGLADGRLTVTYEAHPALPVDHLFQALAAALGPEAIGVVLSGTGSDGALGLAAIKARGGFALVQEPSSARFGEMPRCAITHSPPDRVLTPRGIAEELARLAREGHRAASTPPFDEDTLAQLLSSLRAACGIDFSQYKPSTIRRRLGHRLAALRIANPKDYLALLADDPAEAKALCQELLVRVTGFFRDPDMFASLTAEVFPALLADREASDPIRIWVPGCSTGEEVYSIAIALLEWLGERATAVPIQLFGTDLSPAAIERARAGFYPAGIHRDLTADRLKRFFLKTDGLYRVSPTLRDLCVFACHDLVRDPPFSKLDLISCCNVLIYFGQDMQRRAYTTFHYALKPNGFLVLGPSESVSPQSAHLFQPLGMGRKIYVRRDAPARLIMDYTHSHRDAIPMDGLSRISEQGGLPSLEWMQKDVDRLILAHYSPAGLVLDQDLQVVRFVGQIGPYLDPQAGPASLALRGLVRPALWAAIASAVREAIAAGAPAKLRQLQVATGEGPALVDLDVLPIRKSPQEAPLFLVVLQGAQRPRRRAGRPKPCSLPTRAVRRKCAPCARSWSPLRRST
ncbi:CheR family methyltransferase [Candidatus Methylocalor cossyra]|uniref:protein-glutamate O-methyltransferase n=1 Tax=Candidatus Methylocalor cossyra TaxID=3108543 RepID=A0ABM9NKB3_9GAMM